MSDVNTWSTTASSNNSAVPNGWPDSMASAGINNAAREMMAAIAKWYADKNGSLVTTGPANTYALSPNRTFSAYAAGMDFVLRVNANNTGASTINVSTLGPKDIRDEKGAALVANAHTTNQMFHISYDATNGYFRIVGGPAVLDSTLANTGLLEDYFGPEGYQEVRQLALKASGRRAGGPRVLILPGIMGSKLGKKRPFPLPDDLVWFDPFDIAAGKIADLAARFRHAL